MDKLDNFYAALRGGTTVGNFLAEHTYITTQFIHKNDLTNDYRLARGRVKKLCDEVTPVARFVKENATVRDRIRFALDDTAPDCFVEHENGYVREIEVTVAQAKERHHVMTELNETGKARGYIGLSDEAQHANFNDEMNRDPVGHSKEEIGGSIVRAAKICARRKGTFRGDTLLIEAPLHTMPADHWEGFGDELGKQVKDMEFSEVYVTGSSRDRNICLRIK